MKPLPSAFRVRLTPRGPHVAPLTLATLNAWRAEYGVPYGRAIDAAIDYALSSPAFRLPLDGYKKNPSWSRKNKPKTKEIEHNEQQPSTV